MLLQRLGVLGCLEGTLPFLEAFCESSKLGVYVFCSLELQIGEVSIPSDVRMLAPLALQNFIA
eukprot:4606728-Amphidinium_carterae.1